MTVTGPSTSELELELELELEELDDEELADEDGLGDVVGEVARVVVVMAGVVDDTTTAPLTKTAHAC